MVLFSLRTEANEIRLQTTDVCDWALFLQYLTITEHESFSLQPKRFIFFLYIHTLSLKHFKKIKRFIYLILHVKTLVSRQKKKHSSLKVFDIYLSLTVFALLMNEMLEVCCGFCHLQ